MSFLAPWALGLAALAALPVFLHLFRRDTRRRMAFPAIRYLRQAKDRSARAIKLRDRFLLATRVALVLALAAAAAAPLVGRGDASDHVPTDVFLVIDNTGSMNRVSGEATLLDRQRLRALDLLAAARSSDRFWVVPAVGPVLAASVPAGTASEAVRDVEATDAASDLGAALRRVVGLLPPGTARPREIVVMSDLQASALPRDPFLLPDDISLVVSVTGASDVNGAIARLQATAPGPGTDGAVFVWLVSGGSRTDTVEARLSIGGQTVSIARAESGGSAVLRLPDPGVGEHAISVEIPPSGLRSDDRRSFILRTFAPPVVRHLGPPDSYVGQALRTLEGAGRLRLGEATDESEGWFVEGVYSPGFPTDAGGNWVFSPPGDDALLARFNSGLDRLGVPWRFDVLDVPGGTSLEPSPDVPGLESIRIRGRHRLRRIGAGADTVLVRTSEGSPWLVAGYVSERNYVLIGSPLVPEHTSLPVEAAMLPFLETVLFRWAGLGGNLPAPVPAGVPSMLPADADSVSGPGGRRVRVDGGSPYVPLRAGIHRVFLASGDTTLLAAAVPAAESDLRRAPDPEVTRALGSPSAVLAETEPEWSSAMYAGRRGAMISPYLLAVALALVLAEVLLATPGERGQPTGRSRPAGGSR
jgi:hypothetical protein